MSSGHFLKARVEPNIKARVQSLARQTGVNESTWLRQAVLAAARQSDRDENGLSISAKSLQTRAPLGRVCLRLSPDDQQLLIARAEARGMRPATYVAVLMRAHLRGLTPLPAAELQVFRAAVIELSTVGRHLSALLQHIGAEPSSTLSGRQDVLHMLKICTVLRDHLHAILKINLESWKVGHGKS